jgi:hypothetical protein
MKETKKIECEEMTIQIPTVILTFLRDHEKEIGMSAEQYIANSIIDTVRADINAEDVFTPEPEQIMSMWNLEPVFVKN